MEATGLLTNFHTLGSPPNFLTLGSPITKMKGVSYFHVNGEHDPFVTDFTAILIMESLGNSARSEAESENPPNVATNRSKVARSIIGQTRTLAATQGNMTTVSPLPKAIDDIGQAGCGFGQIGCIDLRDIAQGDHL